MEALIVLGLGVIIWLMVKRKPDHAPVESYSPPQPPRGLTLNKAQQAFYQESLRARVCLLILLEIRDNPKASFDDVSAVVGEFVNDELQSGMSKEAVSNLVGGMMSWYRHACAMNVANFVDKWREDELDDAMKKRVIRVSAEAVTMVADKHNMLPLGNNEVATDAFEKLTWVYVGRYEKREMSPAVWERDVVAKLAQQAERALGQP